MILFIMTCCYLGTFIDNDSLKMTCCYLGTFLYVIMFNAVLLSGRDH